MVIQLKKGNAKKIIGILIALVIILGGLLTFNLRDESKGVMENSDTESYQFKDIERMDKAKTIDDAIDKIFGNDRLVRTENNEDILNDYSEQVENGSYIIIPLFMKVGFDTRMEMIDFLHYIQYSGLTKDSSGHQYRIQMNIYQPIKAGMNLPEPHQKWGIGTDNVEAMDFSDKETMLGEIHRYGEFEGVNPSGMN